MAYRGGSGALAAVLEARRMEVELRIDRLRLEMETAMLWAQLRYLIPDVIPDVIPAAILTPIPAAGQAKEPQR